MFPPLAVLIGLQLARWTESNHVDRLFNIGAKALCIVIGILALTVVIAAGCSAAMLQDTLLVDKSPFKTLINTGGAIGGAITWQVLAAGIVVLAIIAIMAWQLGKGYRRGFLLSGLCANVVCLLATFYCVFPNLYATWSFRDMGRTAKSACNGEVHLCSWGEHTFSLALYADAAGCKKVSSKGTKTMEDLLKAINAAPNTLCLLNDPRYIVELETQSGQKVQVISRKEHYCLVRLVRQGADK